MMFLMLVCVDTEPSDTEPVDATGPVPDVDDWVRVNEGRGTRLLGDRTAPAQDARVVRVRGGKVLVTDGPFIETKEILAGFDVLECADMAEAIEVAAAHPMAYRGVLELRPVWTG